MSAIGATAAASVTAALLTMALTVLAPVAAGAQAQPTAPAVQVPGQPSAPSVPGGQMPQPRPGQPSQPVRDPRNAPTPTGTAVIKGRVVSMDAGTPLRRVQIRVVGQAMRIPRGVLTDAEGRYEIKDLPAGRYQVSATKGGYVMLEYGQRRPLDAGRPLEIADGQTIEKVDFSLPRGGVITGRVVDELGEPVADSMVAALMFRRMGGRRRLMPAASGRPSSTNDIGQFRIFGLPPGEYYVSAGVMPGMFSMMDSVESSSGYAPTYYPGTPSVADAQKVTVTIGEELHIDLQLIPTRVSRISGTVLDSSGRPPANGFVMLQSRDEMVMSGGGGAPIRENGSFVIGSVAPGAYHLSVQVMGMSGAPESREGTTLPVTIAGQDLENVRLATSRGASIQGRVVYEGGTAPAAASVQVRINCVNPDPGGPMMMGGGGAVADEQGQFEIKSVFAPCQIRTMAPGAVWVLKAVTHDGVDVTDRPLTVSGTKGVTGVEVVLTSRQTTLTGAVTDGDGRPLKDYAVVLFPDDKEKWVPMTRYIGRARPDQEGQFKVMGVPPGEYLAVAIENLEQGAETDPEFLERMRPLATRTRLSEDSPQTITLKLAAVQ